VTTEIFIFASQLKSDRKRHGGNHDAQAFILNEAEVTSAITKSLAGKGMLTTMLEEHCRKSIFFGSFADLAIE
jgi:hypothetical protein